jgi:hypothetical protein
MADTVTKVLDLYATSGYDPANKTTPAIEVVSLTADGTEATIVCNHATAASINTRLVKEAMWAAICPQGVTASTASTGTGVAFCYPTTTTYANDTVECGGLVTGQEYSVIIVGRA